MSCDWKILPFDDVVSDETGGNIKTLQSQYMPTGEYPIIDQGRGFIAGYTDDASCLCKAGLPAIVFGDHTKIFKFVDFPFCLGADGTKILRTNGSVCPKYLYHFLSQVDIPDAGYSRHFKYLKRTQIPPPPPSTNSGGLRRSSIKQTPCAASGGRRWKV